MLELMYCCRSYHLSKIVYHMIFGINAWKSFNIQFCVGWNLLCSIDEGWTILEKIYVFIGRVQWPPNWNAEVYSTLVKTSFNAKHLCNITFLRRLRFCHAYLFCNLYLKLNIVVGLRCLVFVTSCLDGVFCSLPHSFFGLQHWNESLETLCR